VEERCLKMFIRGLTSDMNAQEAAKKTKQLKAGGALQSPFALAVILQGSIFWPKTDVP
jgi:hypothetical protein